MIDSGIADRPVVVGVDGSPEGLDAVVLAAQYAVRHHHPLLILRALEWPFVDVPIDTHLSGRVERDLRDEGQQQVQAAADRAHRAVANVAIRTQLVVSGAAAALVGVSTSASAVVVGAHGHSGLADLLVGSVAVQVATHAECPALIARGEQVTGRDVVLGADGSPDSDAAVAFAFAEAAALGVGITAVRAWRHPLSTDVGDMLPIVVEENQAAEERSLSDSIGNWSRKYPEVLVRALVGPGKAAQVLIEASNDGQLVVVGARGHGGFTGLLLGSVGLALLHHSACPVAIIRPSSGLA